MQSGLCTLLLSDTFNIVLSTGCYVLAIGLPGKFDHLRFSRRSNFIALIYCICGRVCVGVHEEVGRQLCGVHSHLPSCGSQALNLQH